MSDATWTIVQFLDDSTVEAVPSSWLQGNYCHWPSLPTEKLAVAIKKAEPLNTCWPSHKIKIFRNGTFDNYSTARNKAKMAEETSDLETEPENGKRKKIQRVLSSSEESLESSILPSPPKIKKLSKRNFDQQKRSNEPSSEAQCSQNNFSKRENMEQVEINDLDEASTFKSTIQVSNPEIAGSTKCMSCTEKDRDLKKILQQGHILRGLVTEALAEVKELKQALVVQKQTVAPGTQSFFTSLSVEFPLSSDDDMLVFEEYLENPADFNNAVAELVKVGGSRPYDFISRAAKLIVSNEQALKYSWLGQKGKRKFSNMRIASLLIEAVHATLASTRKEAETSIQLWLRRAFDRKNYQINKKH